MTDDLVRWLQENSPEALKEKWHELLRMMERKSPADPNFSTLLHDILRRLDDKMLGQVWREWKKVGRSDLAVEVECEMERRKAHSIGRA